MLLPEGGGGGEVNHAHVEELTHALLTLSRLRAQMNLSVHRHAEMTTQCCSQTEKCFLKTLTMGLEEVLNLSVAYQ